MSRSFKPLSFRPRCEQFETRDVPAAFPIPAGAAAISPDDGGIPRVKIVDATTGDDIGEIEAYEAAFRGGVHTTLGDVTGDGVRDVILSPGRGGGPRIRVLDGRTGTTLNDFFVYEPGFTGGIYTAVGDVNGDGRDDIITGTGKGGGPRVRVLDGATLGNTVLRDFFAYEDSFRGGVLVSSGDIDGDGVDDILCGTGKGGGPRVQVFSGDDGAVLQNLFAYEDSFRGGVLVSSGDVDGDGRDDIVCGTGPGGGPVVRVLSGADGRQLAALFADDPAFRGGVRVDCLDVDDDGRDELLAYLRHGNDDGFRAFDDDGRFLFGVSRVVDDDPSPGDTLADDGRVIPGVVSYVEGRLVSADAAAGTATIALRDGTTVTVQAGPGTEIKRDKVEVPLTAFQPGDKVEALVGADGIAWEIEAKSPAFLNGDGDSDDDDEDEDDDSGGGSGSGSSGDDDDDEDDD